MRANPRRRVHVVTMGCAKNVVDSEKLMAQLRASNIELSPSIEGADIAVVNTCGFITAAKEESLDSIMSQLRLKSRGKLTKVYAMGCLTERYRSELAREIPELDGVFGSAQLREILEELGGRYRTELLGERILTTPSHYAFLKISEGCDNPCSFCAIPLMRGLHVSRPIEEILDEAKRLVDAGVRELVLIAQDTTSYGLDLYGSRRLAGLIERIADIDGLGWVRLMYTYPAKFPLEVLDVIAKHPAVCKYIDMPIQHVADPVLRSMRRGVTQRGLRELIDTIRSRVPGVTLRTTMIVGYPTEGPAEFEELLGFVREVAFDRLGAFAYSLEEGTTAFDLGDPVPAEEKERRRGVLMEIQKGISERNNQGLVGTCQKVIVDRAEGGVWIGRTERDAPDVDNEVTIHSDAPLDVGRFYPVDIIDAYEYDLEGRIPLNYGDGRIER